MVKIGIIFNEMIQDQLKKDFSKALKKLKISDKYLEFEHPANLEHGDYSTNIAMRVKKKEYPTPFDLANQIVNTFRSLGLPEYVTKIEVKAPGFINIWLKNEYLSTRLERVLKEKDGFGKLTIMRGKKILLEHTSPNPQTTIMLGHLRNNFLGMSMASILEFLGAKVVKDCIVNDRGVHINRALWGYLFFGRKRKSLKKKELLDFKKVKETQIRKIIKSVDWRELLQIRSKKKSSWWQPKELGLKPDHTNLIWYVLGTRAYNLSPKAKTQVEEMLIEWEAENEPIRQIWRQLLNWSAKGYEETYKRVKSAHDWFWHESDHYKMGKEIVKQGLKKRVFRKSEGAVVTDLAKYNLPDTVVVKSDGTTLYITQDIALTELKKKKFPSDLYIWDVAAEHALYFKQLFTVCEQLGIGKKEKFFHLAYALINFKGGKKLSTRRGEVIKADEVLDELHQRALEIINTSNQELRGKLTKKQLDQLAEAVALGAIKYSLLKFSRDTTIYFDIDESLALEGNSGPYLQYTYARCQSVLRKAESPEISLPEKTPQLEPEEVALLRTIYRFPEVIQEAGENYAPNLLCNFLFDLAQKYNLFYNRLPILKAETEELKDFRLALTTTAGQVIKNGLHLLGIETPERM
ncbi:arginine--tRNA ligase [Patescibacteria group bacterium]|nr:arginine--tRNA ligase [Patescibacteria group bacterium]